MALDKAPDAFRTISEVAEEINVPQHVLRFWESRFTQIRPLKRGGGRRYYRPDDVDLLRGVRHLLYGEGYTIRGVQRILREEGLVFRAGCLAARRRTAGCRELEDEDEAESAGEFEGEAEAEDEAESEAEGEVGPTSHPREPSFFAGPSTTATRTDVAPRAQSGAAGRRAGAALGR